MPHIEMFLYTALLLMTSLVCCLAEDQVSYEGQNDIQPEDEQKRSLIIGQINQVNQINHPNRFHPSMPMCDMCIATSSCLNPTTLIVPMNSSQSLYIRCESPNPYCDSAVASCVPYFPQIYFYCRGDGQYPHVNDCKGSFLCRYGKVIDQPCPEGTQYSHHKKACTKHKHHCPKIDCKNKNGVYVGHPFDESLYILCVAGLVSSMYSCPHGYIYKPGSPDPCVFTCRGEGQYPDFKTPSKYYDCLWIGHKFKLSVLHCPSGYIYSTCDGHTYKCLRTITDCTNPCGESRIPDCRPPCTTNVCQPPPCAPCSERPFFVKPRSLNEISGKVEKTGVYQNETNVIV